jgi:hypothetical protein
MIDLRALPQHATIVNRTSGNVYAVGALEHGDDGLPYRMIRRLRDGRGHGPLHVLTERNASCWDAAGKVGR